MSARVDDNNVFRNIGKIFTTLDNKLEKDVREHLKNVYSTLTLCLFTAIIGGIVNNVLNLYSLGFLFAIAQFALIFAIVTTPASRETQSRRFAYLLAFAFLVGCNTGPLVEFIGAQDPSIVFNAYLVTIIVFGCFTLSALYAESTKFLHLGGALSSGLLILMITALFARSPAVYSFILWGGLFINCGFIVYDTQLIAERRRRGDTDHISGALELFMDFVNVFRYILILLKEKSDNDRRRRRND